MLVRRQLLGRDEAFSLSKVEEKRSHLHFRFNANTTNDLGP